MEQSTSQQRLQIIEVVSPTWASQLREFVAIQPEYEPFIAVAPLQPKQRPLDTEPENVFETILYCMLSAGVRAAYGKKLYDILRAHFREHGIEVEVELPSILSPTKKKYICSLLDKMHCENLTPQTLTYQKFIDCDFIKGVKGIGQTTLAHVKRDYADDFSVYPLTDRTFMRGVAIVYGQHTKREYEEILYRLSNHKVAQILLSNIACYWA